MNPLPPQAYTKETLLKAYSWVMNQSASIKDMATTPDILVSLYLKATRDGESALDRPSIQNFKKELKSLAGMMGELDRIPVATPSNAPAGSPRQPQAASHVSHSQSHSQPSSATPPLSHLQSNHSTAYEKTEPLASMPASSTMPNIQADAIHDANTESLYTSIKSDLRAQLDPSSLAMIHEVKIALNLSSDLEAMRMLIKIGYTRSQMLLK